MTLQALPVHVALVDRTGAIGMDLLTQVAGALNRQVQEDFAPIWHVRATVGAYATAQPGMWSIFMDRDLDEPGALGYHTDEHGQPVSYVDYDDGEWTVTASHELLEMLADPFGMRMHGARLPQGLEEKFKQFGLKTHYSHVSYLLEVADPPERISYDVGGVKVSDFILPSWYRSTAKSGESASLISGIEPRIVLDGGYVSFHVHGDWWQVFNRRGFLQVAHLGRFDSQFGSLRAFTDHHARIRRSS